MVSIKRIVFFISILFATLAQAQQNKVGIPYFENIPFSKIGYSGGLGNIVQSDEGIIFAETDNGILYFNGASWNVLLCKGFPTLYADRQGEILVSTSKFIGKIIRNSQNQLQVVSIVDDTVQLNEIQSVVPIKGHVYFVMKSTLYELNNGMPTLLEQIPGVQKLFVDRDRLLIATDKSVYFYNGKTVCQNNSLAIIAAQRTDNYLYLLTSNGIIRCSNNSFDWLQTDIDSIKSDFSCLVRVSANSICVGTYNHGLFCLNENGTVLHSFSESVGLLDDRILGMMVDKNSNVWTTTRNGISRVEIHSAISYYNKYNGLRGNVLSVVRYGKNELIVGTDCGVFKIDGKGCKKVCEAQCNAVTKTSKGEIIAATNKGLQLLIPSQSQLEQTLSAGDFQYVTCVGNYIISVSKERLSVWNGSPQTYPKYLPTVSFPVSELDITSIAKGANDCFAFCGTKQSGLWMIKKVINSDSTKSLNLVPCDWQGLPKDIQTVCVFETSSGTIFSTYDGLYRCDTINKFFYRDSRIVLPDLQGNTIVSPIIEDADQNLWMAFQKVGTFETQVAVAWNTNNRERYTLITAPFAKLRGSHIDHILSDDNSVFWLGGKDGMIRMDFNKLIARKVLGNVELSRVLVDNDSLLSQTVERTVLSYNTNSILFDFVSIEYENHDDILYSYYLEGFDLDWSQPAALHVKEYRDLPSGKYTFHVVAKRANGASSKETTFSFEIKQHPLLSIWAMAFYAVLFVALLLWLMRIRSKGLAREHKVVTKIVETKTKDLQEDKEKSDNLLTNMLPDEAARELKETGRVRSMNFEMVTVLFSDFKGFTKIADRISADALIQELDKYFSEFDKIVGKYNVEKIKTIGDAYMCAGGIPKKNTTNPIEVVAVALEMQHRLSELQKELPDKSELWGVRIGVHTGPVIAGVVGSKKYSYDIWGDSVNVANRMESSGEVGRVNVSESTYLLIRDIFDCEYRGKVPVKGKDEKMDMYFVNGFKAMYAENPLRSLPNKEFAHKLALFRFDGLQEQIYSMLEQNLPSIYFYHSIKHTIDVVAQVEIIGQAENVNDEDMYILKTAALFHDSGFMHSYRNHEHESIKIAKEILPNEGYSSEQIARICRLIECTIISEEPRNLLEQIIRDADLDYLGRSDYESVSRELYKEFLEMKIVKKNEYEWLLGQIKFLQEHTYYTNYSRSNRNPEKVRHIKKLQEQITKFNIIV